MSTPPAAVSQSSDPLGAAEAFGSFKFLAFEALVHQYASRGAFEKIAASASTGDLNGAKAADWLFAQRFLNEAQSSFNMTLDHAKFGVNGWISLTRQRSEHNVFSYLLKAYRQDKQRLLFERPISVDCVGKAVLGGRSLLATALADYPNVARECAEALLDGATLARVGAEVEASVLDDFIVDVFAAPGTARRTSL